MQVTALGPVDGGRRGRLQQFQQGLGILDRTTAIQDDGSIPRRLTLTARSPSGPAPAGPLRRPAGSCPHSRGRWTADPAIGLSTTSSRSRMASISRAAIFPAVSVTTRSLAARSERGLLRQIHQLRERANRHDPVAQDESFVVLDLADPVRSQANGFGHRVHGNPEHLPAGLHDHDARHRDVQREIEPHRRPRADAAGERHPATDAFDGGPHHVHSDAAPGNIRDLGRGRKAGREDQIDSLLVGQGGQLVGRAAVLVREPCA